MFSKITTKGQTTIPGEVREALGIKPGDRLEFTVEGDHGVFRVHPGAASLAGALASNKGKQMTFAQIRAAATKASRTQWAKRYDPHTDRRH